MSEWIGVVEVGGVWWWSCSHPSHGQDDPVAMSSRRARARLPKRTREAALRAGVVHARVHQTKEVQEDADA